MNYKEMRTIATAQDPGLVRSFRGHEKSINSVCFDSEMKQLVSAGGDAVVHVWNFKPQLRPYKFIGHKGKVFDVAFTNDGKTIISAGEDKELRFWKNSVQGKCFSIKAHSSPILKLSIAKSD
jgi:centriolar protein POC1